MARLATDRQRHGDPIKFNLCIEMIDKEDDFYDEIINNWQEFKSINMLFWVDQKLRRNRTESSIISQNHLRKKYE